LSEKIYSFFLKGLAKAAADNYNHGQAIAHQAPDGLQAKGYCWEEKSIREGSRRGSRIESRRWKIAFVEGEAILYLPFSIPHPRSSSGAFVDESSIHSQFKGAIS